METTKQALRTEKKKRREEKELSYWQRLAAKPKIKYYFPILIVALTIVYIVDEITSNIGSAMQPYVIFELFNIPNADILSPEYATAVGKMTLITVPTMALLFLAPFYKSLSDRFGRRIFLVINTLGMGLGLFVCLIAPNFPVYLIGTVIIAFVIPNDVQVMYIMECAPIKHRAKLCSVTKAIALVSVSLIGVFRGMFYDPNNLTSWRLVYIIPAIIAVVVGVMAIFLKETPVFIKERVEYLSTSNKAIEEKTDNKKNKGTESKKGGVIPAIKYILSHKQTRAIAITALVFSAATAVTNYYATILEAAKETGVITTENITQIIVFFPFINGLVTFVSGFFTDKLGRKRSSVLLGTLASIGLIGFVFGARLGWNQYLIGAAYGLFIGGLWSVSDILFLVMPAESSPTELRASVMGTMSLMLVIGMLVSVVFIVVGQMIVGAENTGLLSLCICIPFMIFSLFLLMKNVKETKGVDLSAISVNE